MPVLQTIPTKQIVAGADNPRGEVDTKSEAFEGLCKSIEARGILQPIVVGEPNGNGKHRLIAGHRRHAAATKLGLSEMPAMVFDEQGTELIIALTENIQREDLSPVAEGEAIKRLREQLGFTQEQAADALGKSVRWARDREKLVVLPEKTKEAFDSGAIPLEAAPDLVRIAEQAPQAAEALAQQAIAEDTLEDGEGEPLNYARPDQLIHAIENSINEDDAGTGVAGSLYEVSYTVRLGDLRQFGLPEETLADFERRWKEIESLDQYRRIEFGSKDLDDARAFGCLLVLESTNHFGESVSTSYITDREWLADRVDELLKRALQGAKERAKERGKPTTPKPEKGSEEEKAAKEKRRQEGEAELEHRERVRAANLELGQRAGKALQAPKLTLEEAKAIALIAVGPFQSDLGGRGLVYCFHDFQEEEKLANGKVKVTYKSAREVGDQLVKSISAAKTPDAVFGIVLQAQFLAMYADQECVTESARSWWSVPSEARSLLAQSAEKRAILPDAIRVGVEKHRRLMADEAEQQLLAAVARSRAKAGVPLGTLLGLPLVELGVVDTAVDVRRLSVKEHGEAEPTYTITGAGKKRLEKLKAAEKERQAE